MPEPQSDRPDLYDTLNAVGLILLKQSDVFCLFTIEYPGFIALQTDGGGVWNIGTANGTWGADLYISPDASIQEAPDHSITTDVPADEQDAQRIADALYRAMLGVK